VPVLVIEPAGGLGRLQSLARQAEPLDGDVGEVGAGGVRLHRRRLRQPVPVGVADLPDRDRDQPRPERGRIPQLAHAADGAEHGLLHDVVDVRVPVHRTADDVVDERQIRGRERVKSPPVAALRGGAAEQSYAALVEKVGSSVRAAADEQSNLQTTVTAISDQRQSVSGVSLDEEMTNLIAFQRGYQASARTLTAMDEMLDTLIEHTGTVGT